MNLTKKYTRRNFLVLSACAAVAGLTACSSEPEGKEGEDLLKVAGGTGEMKNEGGGTELENSTGKFTTTADLSEIDKYRYVVSDADKKAMEGESCYGQTLTYFVSDGCSSGSGVADAFNFFQDAGLTVDGYVADPSSAQDATGTGKVTLCIDHLASSMVPATNGLGVVWTGGAHVGCKSLYVLPDSGYKSTADLKGTKIAVPSGIGAADYNMVCSFLDTDGMDPLNDVTMVPLQADACVTAMQNGEISAALLSDGFAGRMRLDGQLVVIRSITFDDDYKDLPCCLIVMNRDFVEKNPVHAKVMTNCVHGAHKWINDHLDDGTQLLQDMGLVSPDWEVARAYVESIHLGLPDEQTEAGIRYYADQYIKLGLITKYDSAKDIMDLLWKPTI